MNSLNVLSSLRSSQAKASNRGLGTNLSEKDENQASRAAEEREAEADDISDSKTEDDLDSDPLLSSLGGEDGNDYASTADPKRPLLADSVSASSGAKGLGANGRVRRTSKKVASAAFCALRIILQAFIAPARFILTCFRNDDGSLSALSPLRRLNRAFYRPRRKTKGTKEHKASVAAGLDTSSSQGLAEKYQTLQNGSGEVDAGNLQTVPTTFSDSEQDTEGTPDREKGPLESAHSHKDERPTSGRIWRLRSTNVKQQNQSKKRNGRTSPSSEQQHNLDQEPAAAAVTAALLKSPTGPGSTLMATKYPQARLPRHPLLPRRQPSYNTGYFSSREPQKTLILDLDETLIHSMAKGGRMSTGHMVEVRLQRPVGISGTIIESQLPILYYVHKRPHCDEFLKKVLYWITRGRHQYH